MTKHTMRSWMILAALLLGACGAFDQTDTQATLRAENGLLAREATAVSQEVAAFQTEVQGTAQAAETRVREVNAVNQILIATLRSGAPPTPGAILALGIGTPVPGSGPQFRPLTIGTGVNGAGCIEEAQTEFAIGSIGRIYASAQAFNIPPNTRIAMEIRREGLYVFRESWVVSRGISGDCVWTTLDSVQNRFEPGRWTVKFFVDGQPVEPVGVFTIAGR